MFKRILVPLDLSRRNGRTTDTARALAQLHHARVTLLHVVQQIPDVAASELRAFYRRLERVSARRLEHIADRFTARGLRVAVAVCIGEPAREIVKTAASKKIDLIVMGSHKVRPGPRRTVGALQATRLASSVSVKSCWSNETRSLRREAARAPL
jgi:nucleotide-binding universal stress UspA family protein